MRWLLIFTLCLGLAAAQTRYDTPIARTTTDFQEVLTTLASAESTLFITLPSLETSELALVLEERARAGVTVYAVIAENGKGNVARNLINAGVQIKTMPNIDRTLAVSDYATLVAGDLLLGQGEATIVDTSSDLQIVRQLAALWQSAAPY